MKALIDYYIEYQDYASERTWENWPFHNIYNYYESKNGNVTCKEKWRNLIDKELARLKEETDFDRLYLELFELAKDVPGIGSLHVYDTATCFLQPKTVHLNCGALEATKAMGIIKIEKGQALYADFLSYNSDFGKLTPLQLEDFLCINKKVFKGTLTPEQQLQEHKRLSIIKATCKGNASGASGCRNRK